jgi:uncharacterized protein (TIGR00255 family)
MTGFGQGAVSHEEFSVSVELKAVNNRFLDIHLRINSELSPLEGSIRKRISSRLSRGRIDASIVVDRSSQVNYELNRPIIMGYLSALRLLQEEFKIEGVPDINALLRLPGAMQPAREKLGDEIVQGLEKALDIALTGLEEMRAREGEELGAEMRDRLRSIEASLPAIERAAESQLDTYRARLNKRISDFLSRETSDHVVLDQGRLAQEVAFLVDRSDITEELARLRSHLSQFQQVLSEKGEVGKRMDFLLQELNREANTILSKSSDITIKEAALQIKAEVEKLREQVQNVE